MIFLLKNFMKKNDISRGKINELYLIENQCKEVKKRMLLGLEYDNQQYNRLTLALLEMVDYLGQLGLAEDINEPLEEFRRRRNVSELRKNFINISIALGVGGGIIAIALTGVELLYILAIILLGIALKALLSFLFP